MDETDSHTDVVVAHPVTGELVDKLDAQPAEKLADVLVAIRRQIKQLTEMQTVVEDELRVRLTVRAGGENTIAIFGDYEISAPSAWSRVWDADELEGVLADLRDRGVITAHDVTGIFHDERKVRSREATTLLNRLNGPAKEAVKACFTWRERPGKLEVARSVQLIPEGGPPA